jgi:AbrB family looped-hinge helix DNA binding protein
MGQKFYIYLDIQKFLTILNNKKLKQEGFRMAVKKEKPVACFSGPGMGCCQVEAMVSVDEKGQMVLPKTIREKAGIQPGDKLVLIGWEKDGQTCCITMVKADSLAGMVKGMLGPMMKDIMAS